MTLDTSTKRLIRDPANNYLRRRAWVQYQLLLLGRNLASIAKELGVHRKQPAIALVKPYPKMEKAIADTIGITPQELFPERYDADGLPNRKRGRPFNSSNTTLNQRARARNVHGREAA